MAEWFSSWLAEQEDRVSFPGLASWIFRDWLSPASKSRYDWKIAKSKFILKTTNQPITKLCSMIYVQNIFSYVIILINALTLHVCSHMRGSRNFRQRGSKFPKILTSKKKKGGKSTRKKTEGCGVSFASAEVWFKSTFQTIISIQVYFQ